MTSDKRHFLPLFLILALLLLTSGCTGFTGYPHPSFNKKNPGVRSILILQPLVDIKEEHFTGNRQTIPSIIPSLKAQAIDELERVFKENGYEIHKQVFSEQELEQNSELRNNTRIVIGRFSDMTRRLRRHNMLSSLDFSIGSEAKYVGEQLGSDTIVLLNCQGSFQAFGATLRDVTLNLVTKALAGGHGFGIERSAILLQLAVVRSQDGTVLWYGDNRGSQNFNPANQNAFRSIVRKLAQKFPARNSKSPQ